MAAAASVSSVALPAQAETVIEQAARTGEITMAGPVNIPPFSDLGPGNQLQGYVIDLSKRVAAEVGAYLGRPLKIQFQRNDDPRALFRSVSIGEVDLACGFAFTWQREMYADYSLPIARSGIRLLTGQDGDGSAQSLVGARIGVVKDSLGQTVLAQIQPKATAVVFPTVQAATDAFFAGQVKGVMGDSILLANRIPKAKAASTALVPDQSYLRYGIGCIVPEGNSTFRNLVSLAIARVQQGYLDGDAESTALVNRWFGPGSALALSPEVIKAFFDSVLSTHEQVEAVRPPQIGAKP